MGESVLIAAIAVAGAGWVAFLSMAEPRLLLYLILALAPTQFLFVPVSDFFLSPADVLVVGALIGFVSRLAAVERPTWRALRQHRFMLLVVLSYVVGFLALGVFSRTLVRLPLGFSVSILACEVLRTRRQILRAGAALMVAGAIDAGYGLYFLARGTPLHPTRFSGMSDVNFSAMLLVTAAAIALAQLARTRRVLTLLRPGMLAGIALATLSQMGFLALLGAWISVLRRIVSRPNKRRIMFACVVVAVFALMFPSVRARIASRNAREVQLDGVARNSADIRLMVVQAAWIGFREHPVLGLGYYQFPTFSLIDPEIKSSTQGQGYLTHNSYLEVLVEGGLLTFALFLLHWVQYMTALPRALRRIGGRHDVTLAAGVVGFPVVMICAALANVLMVYSFWAICGVALASLNLLAHEARQDSAQAVVTAQ